MIVKVGLQLEAHVRIQAGKAKSQIYTIEFPKASGIGSTLDVGVEGELK